jgi:branched-chain amino acid transport system ATP-binding protein
MSKVLEVSNVRAGYGDGDVLQGIALRLLPGEIVAVVGRNGVGKTTFLKTVIGLIPVTAGSIRFWDTEVSALPARRRSAKGMGYVPQGRQIFPGLTVRENLLTGEQVNREAKERRLRYDIVYNYFPILRDRGGQLAGTLSGGQQQMLAIGRALVGDPRLLLLDEPSAGIQPSIVQEICNSLAQLNQQEGLTILLVEQNIGVITQLAQRAYAMNKGRIQKELSAEEVVNREVLIQYLAL